MIARGIRNNNPANIRRTGERWQGMKAKQTDGAFVQFDSMIWGVRALLKTLHTYVVKYDLHSPKEIISRYAPPVENWTDRYIDYIWSELVGNNCKTQLALSDFGNESVTLFVFAHAMCNIESGYNLSWAMFIEAEHLCNFK